MRRFMPLARSLAMRYRRQTESLDDLVQVAGLGLVKAVDGFDPSPGGAFAAYAVPTILGELRRHFRDHVWNVRLPRGLQELTMKVDEATSAPDRGARALSDPDRDRRAARDLGRGGARGAGGRPRAPDAVARRAAPRDDEDAATGGRGDRRRGARATTGSRPTLASDAAGLDEREWRVLRMRFVEELTQQEIGRRLGVSQMQISRISRRALWKLLAAVRGEAGRPGPGPPSAAGTRAARRIGGRAAG